MRAKPFSPSRQLTRSEERMRGIGERGEIRAPLENQCSQDVALGKSPHAYIRCNLYSLGPFAKPTNYTVISLFTMSAMIKSDRLRN